MLDYRWKSESIGKTGLVAFGRQVLSRLIFMRVRMVFCPRHVTISLTFERLVLLRFRLAVDLAAAHQLAVDLLQILKARVGVK